jgi:hypothetical protein
MPSDAGNGHGLGVTCLGYALIAENVEPLIPGLDPSNLPLT